MKYLKFFLVILFALTLNTYYLILTTGPTKAATGYKLTISDSRAEQTGVEYDFSFTASANTAIKQVGISFCTTATGSCTAPTGFSVGTPTFSSDNISGTGRTPSKTGENVATQVISTPATQDPLAVTINMTGLTNPTTINTTAYARITTYSDGGSTVIDTMILPFAILTSTSLAMSASTEPTLTFTVAAASGTVNGATTNVTTTATTIPFGMLAAGIQSIGAHNLTVITNATTGYMISVRTTTDPPMADSSNNIDKFTGTNATPAVWSAPAGGTPNVNTGFVGYTTEDTTLSGASPNRFSSNKWAGFTTSPEEIAYSTSATSGSGETTKVGWQAEINSIQPPGSYTGTVILVATPTY